MSDLTKAATDFALPQITIIKPRVVICLGRVTFTARQLACSHAAPMRDLRPDQQEQGRYRPCVPGLGSDERAGRPTLRLKASPDSPAAARISPLATRPGPSRIVISSRPWKIPHPQPPPWTAAPTSTSPSARASRATSGPETARASALPWGPSAQPLEHVHPVIVEERLLLAVEGSDACAGVYAPLVEQARADVRHDQ